MDRPAHNASDVEVVRDSCFVARRPLTAMKVSPFKSVLVLLAGSFTVAFFAVCPRAFMKDPDVARAIAGGFVNPFATLYSLDAIGCWFVLATWVLYESKHTRMRHGWVALLLGIFPGVTVGFAVYLLIRFSQAPEESTMQRPLPPKR